MLQPLAPTPAQVVTVAKSGSMFTSIQDAIDSITDASASKRYVIEIYPGTYTENVVLGEYMILEGRGDGIVAITSSSGTTLTMPSSDSFVDHIKIISTPTASGAIAVDITAGGTHIFEFTAIELTSASNGITGILVKMGGSSEVTFVDMDLIYTMTGSAVGSNDHCIIKQDDASILNLFRSNVFTTVGDVDDNVNVLCDNSTGNTIIVSVNWTTFITNAAYSGIATTWEHSKTSVVHLDQYSLANMIGAGSGTAQIIKMDTDTNDGIIDAGYNTVVAVNFGTSWHINVGTGDTVNSAFDLNTGGLETTGAGIVNYFGSSANGQLKITGGAEFTIDTANEWHAMNTLIVDDSDANIDIRNGLTGSISAFADYSGTVAGTVKATDVGHGLATGDNLTQTGTTNYNGVFQITVIDADNYYFTDTWVADDATGTWRHGSHLTVKQRGWYRLGWSFSAASAGNNISFDFAAFNDATEIDGTELRRKFGSSGDVGVVASTPLIFLEKDAHIWFGIRNVTDATNTTLSEGTLNLSKTS